MRGNPVRKQVLVFAAVALVVAAGAVVWYMLTQHRVGSMLAQGGRTNLLVIGHDGFGQADAMTLVSLSTDDAVFLSIPTDVRVKHPEGGLAPIASVFTGLGPQTTADTVVDLLGIDVPFFVSADRDVLAEWIDSIGELAITLDEMVIYSDISSDPPMQTEIHPGTQTMTGSAAVSFAVSPALPGDIGRISRQQIVLRALVGSSSAGLSTRALRSAIRAIYPLLETNCAVGDLLEIAGVLRDVDVSEAGPRTVLLPTEQRVTDGGIAVDPKIVEVERIIASSLKGLDLLTPDEINVAVFNGNGIREVASRTAEYLRARGFAITRIGNADSFEYSPSYIVVLTDEAKAWVLQDALPPNEIRIVFPETFNESYQALRDYVPAGTDLLLIVGAGMVLE